MNTLSPSEQLQALAERLRPFYDRLADHPLYRSFETLQDLHLFMESHVFAVWDFMSLLKALQRSLTGIDLPWLPSRFPESRRLINEIVLGEESDIYGTRAISHFELYLHAMRESGASTDAIDALIQQLRDGGSVTAALALCGAPGHAQRFVQSTFQLIERGEIHAIAAAFTFGREDLIPEMFRGFLRDLDAGQYTNESSQIHRSLRTLRWYFDRHIEVDGEDHGPMALRMISELCGDDARKWSEATDAAETALRARIALWDGIAASLKQTEPTEQRPTLSVH
jgi:hypothetical protein